MKRSRISIAVVALVLCTALNAFASSNPIPGVGIVVKRNPGSSTARTTTDKDGNFRIEGLEPGTYTIEVQQPDVDKFFARTMEDSKRVRTGSTLNSARMSEADNNGNAGNSGQAGGIAEMCITSCPEVTIDGSTKKAGEQKFYKDPASSKITCTVSADGVISGQLRAGISTSRSNLRTK